MDMSLRFTCVCVFYIYFRLYIDMDIYIYLYTQIYSNSCTNIIGVLANLSALASNSSGQLDVLWHDSDPFSVNSAKISIFE